MAVALHEQGLFSWSEWGRAGQIQASQAAGDADLGDTYDHHWLTALDRLGAEKGASSLGELTCYRLPWDHAADRTPHGQPIELEPADFTE
jgi:nitrile hydratase accessory protein